MISKIIEKLKEVDNELQERIKSAHNGLRNHEEVKCSQARIKVQEAITELLHCG